jgi:hypothetical protein
MLVTLSVLAVTVAAIRFLFDGVQFHFGTHTFGFDHTDPLSYGSILTPILGAHSYIGTRGWKKSPPRSNLPDNPDSSDDGALE